MVLNLSYILSKLAFAPLVGRSYQGREEFVSRPHSLDSYSVSVASLATVSKGIGGASICDMQLFSSGLRILTDDNLRIFSAGHNVPQTHHLQSRGSQDFLNRDASEADGCLM